MKVARSWGGECDEAVFVGVDGGGGGDNEDGRIATWDVGFVCAGRLDRGRREEEEEGRGSKEKLKCALKLGDAWPERRIVGNLLTGGGGSIVN